MSGRRTRKPSPPAWLKTLAADARCGDCPGRATVRWARGDWDLTLHHAGGCPARLGALGTLHADAERAVAAASARSGVALEYEALSSVQGLVTGSSGVVTGGG